MPKIGASADCFLSESQAVTQRPTAIDKVLPSGAAVSSPFKPRDADLVTAALRPFRGALFTAGTLSLISNLLMLAGPLFMIQIYDRVLASRSLPTLVALTILVAGSFAFMALLDLIRARLMVQVGAGLDHALRSATFDAVISHALRRTPNVAGQPLRDAEAIRHYISGPGLMALFDMPWMPIYLALNYAFHPLLGLLTLVGVVVLFLLAALNEAVTRRAATEAAGASQRSHAIADEARRAAEVLKAMGMQEAYRGRWNGEYQKAQHLQMQAANKAGLFNASTRALRLFQQSAALAAGAALAITGEISPGTIIAASILMSRALSPVEQATAHWPGFQNARRAWGRLRQVLHAALDVTPPAMTLPPPRGDLAVERVFICPPGRPEPIVQGADFELKAGDGLGIIGPSGSGKSTLARALVGVWPLAKGAVRLDGASLDQWPAAQLGSAVGYVPQDVELLSGTVRENISRFLPDPDPEEVVRAAQRANVHEMILRLPDGYATELGDAGSQLSAGQKQRIALARALYGRPVLLVLDEPNSNLDAAGETALSASIAGLRRDGVTVILIAHRRTALAVVDRLLFMRDGRQIAFGPKTEVLGIAAKHLTAAGAPIPVRPSAQSAKTVAGLKAGIAVE